MRQIVSSCHWRLSLTAALSRTAEGSTNYAAGFNLAFQTLSSSRGSGCHNMVLFMTDGNPDSSISSVLKDLERLNTPTINARIFTYALGSEAAAAAPKSIACAHKGVFAAIPDNGDLRSKMAQYYQYIAVSSVRNTVMWSEPYIDCCGLGNVTSVSLACYAGENPPQLLGVVGSTVPFNFLGSMSLQHSSKSKSSYRISCRRFFE